MSSDVSFQVWGNVSLCLKLSVHPICQNRDICELRLWAKVLDVCNMILPMSLVSSQLKISILKFFYSFFSFRQVPAVLECFIRGTNDECFESNCPYVYLQLYHRKYKTLFEISTGAGEGIIMSTWCWNLVKERKKSSRCSNRTRGSYWMIKQQA